MYWVDTTWHFDIGKKVRQVLDLTTWEDEGRSSGKTSFGKYEPTLNSNYSGVTGWQVKIPGHCTCASPTNCLCQQRSKFFRALACLPRRSSRRAPARATALASRALTWANDNGLYAYVHLCPAIGKKPGRVVLNTEAGAARIAPALPLACLVHHPAYTTSTPCTAAPTFPACSCRPCLHLRRRTQQLFRCNLELQILGWRLNVVKEM
ncbi:hypothetical protein C8J57DRAFT_1471826 [Mycena rebaudengoi]|nr:hypothetical protein C8J57DRAFT_1471826 [Mycena rebaudengoi]